MNIFGVQIPSIAVAIGSMIGAFILGLGMGAGSELSKYYVHKYLTKRIDHVVKGSKKIIKKLYAK